MNDSSQVIFSDELLKRGQKYFEKLCKRKISLEETESWLDSLAELYLVFAKNSDKEY